MCSHFHVINDFLVNFKIFVMKFIYHNIGTHHYHQLQHSSKRREEMAAINCFFPPSPSLSL